MATKKNRQMLLKRVGLKKPYAIGLRRLNSGLYSVLVEIRTGRMASYYGAGTILDGSFTQASSFSDKARPAIESDGFPKAIEELLEFAAADSVMSE